MRRCSWFGIVVVLGVGAGVFGCSGSSSDDEGASTAAASPPAEADENAEPPEPVEAPAEVPEGVDEAALPATEAPPPGLDPAFDAAQPTRGGAHSPFEAVPQDVFTEDAESTLVSPDGHLAAIASASGAVAVYDTRLGVVRAARRFFRRAYDTVRFAWDSSSGHLAAYSTGEICLWHLSRDEYLCAPVDHEPLGLSVARYGNRIIYQAVHGEVNRLYTWTMERAPHRVADLPAGTEVSATAAFSHHVLVTYGGHTWLYTAWGRDAPPIDLGEVTLPEHPFAPNGRSFITLTDTSVQQRNPSDGVITRDVPLANARERVRVAIHRDGSRAALCAPDGPVALVRFGQSASAQENPEAVCSARSRPKVGRDAATVVSLDASGLDERRHRDVRTVGREYSLWSLELGEGRAVTHRREGAERFSAAGIRRVRTSAGVEDSDDAEGFTGLVARSPSRRSVLRINGRHEPVLLTRETRVPLVDATRLSCDEYMGCAVIASWDHDEGRLALMHANLVEVFDTATGARLGHWSTGRGCRAACGDGLVCVHGHCEEPSSVVGNAEFSPDGERLVAVAGDGSVGLFNVAGERLQRLAPPDARAVGRQFFAFSPDSAQVALVRRRRLTLVRATDGTEVWNTNLTHPLLTIAFSADGQSINLIDTDKKLVRVNASDGSSIETREAGTLRAADGHGRYAVTCRDGLTYLQYLSHGTERGPLGHCPPGGRFVIAPDTGLLGHVQGTLARVHRLSDGEVLNLRAIWRDSSRLYVAYTDSGWAQVVGGRNSDVYVRTGPIARGALRHRGASDRIRETLLADFFGGVELPEPPSANRAAEEPEPAAPAGAAAVPVEGGAAAH